MSSTNHHTINNQKKKKKKTQNFKIKSNPKNNESKLKMSRKKAS